ncbi:hypothetical protein RJ527_08815 [Thalassospiraceae bacterium LMO-SO8]|nr:hypothetical protein [Alphaproteobacteria bacterium LMO-S08]WND77832.1 hypothetical protein RJ527_08815 [Thalassospiraceae bacterium LMO-SO8]
MPELTEGGWALCLAAADGAVLAGLVWWLERRARTQAQALDDARHEFETGLAFLESRLRIRRRTADKLPSIDDEGA